jgi:hypothetical protein
MAFGRIPVERLLNRLIALLETIQRRLNEPPQEIPRAIAQQPESTSDAAEIASQIDALRRTEAEYIGKLVNAYKTAQAEDTRRQRRMFGVQLAVAIFTFLAFLAAAIYAGIAWDQKATMDRTYTEIQKQTRAAQDSASAAGNAVISARDALALNRENFRKDERPYIALILTGAAGAGVIPETGEHAGHLIIEFKLTNYGKSPGIEIGNDARIAIGSVSAKRIRLHPLTDLRTAIVPPTEKPSIYAYSDEPVSSEAMNEIRAGKLLAIVYGHIEYTDLLAEPRPVYITEFCIGLSGLIGPMAREAESDCKGHIYLK